MAIDASIYRGLSQFQAPDYAEHQERAARLSGLQMQNANSMNKMAREDKQAGFEDQQRRMTVIGRDLDTMAGMKPEERAAMYPKFREQWLQAGVVSPQEAPEQFDDQLFSAIHSQYKASEDSRKRQESEIDGKYKQAQIRHLGAQDAKLYADARSTPSEKLPTQSQFTAATFGTRAGQAEKVFEDLAQAGYDPTAFKNVADRKLPGFLEGFKGSDTKQQEQAERNFVNAILRRESGAAISDGEFDNASAQYFPRHGDSPEVLRQKEENRKTAIAALEAEGAPAMGRIANSLSSKNFGDSVPNRTKSLDGVAHAAPAVPKHGTEEDGFVFMGGDPSNPKSWKRAR